MPRLTRWVAALLAAGWAFAALGHGLTLTTAGVSLRNGNHLMLHLQYDPLRLWHRVNDVEGASPIDLTRLANLPDAEFEAGYAAMRNHLRREVVVRLGDRPVESLHFRFPPAGDFRRAVREGFMRGVLAARQGGGHSHDDARHYYQQVSIDGFLPPGAAEGDLDLRFPPSLGDVMVTFTRPRSWTLRAGEEGSRLAFSIDPGEPRGTVSSAE